MVHNTETAVNATPLMRLRISDVVLAVLLGVGSRYSFDAVGVLFRADELLGGMLAVVYLFTRGLGKKGSRAATQLQPILGTLALWFVVQVISDAANRTALPSATRGLGAIVITAVKVYAYWCFFAIAGRRIPYFLVGQVVGGVFFGQLETSNIAILRAEFWDLKVASWGGPVIALCTYVLGRRHAALGGVALAVYGGAAVAYGARAHGAAAVLAGGLSVLIGVRERGAWQRIQANLRAYLPHGIAVCTFAFLLFVTLGLSGHITRKTQAQLQQLENPYNPIEVVLAARSTTANGVAAILERPLLGYGDKGHSTAEYYRDLELPFGSYAYAHSCVLEAGTNCGVLGAVVWLYLLFATIRTTNNTLCRGDATPAFTLFLSAMMCWAILFSPLASARIFWPAYFAILCSLSAPAKT